MAPRKNNLIPDMRETRYKTETFANPYAPAAPKPFNFATAKGGSSINASTGYRTPQNLDPNRNIGGTYYNTRAGMELYKDGQILSMNGEFYRPKNSRDSWGIFTDTRPGWMQQQDLANANRATYGSAVPSAGQLAYEMIGVGYDKSGKFGIDPVNIAVGAALAGSGKLFRGALGAVERYQGAKLATKLAQFDAEILANRASIRAAGRAAADVRQAARKARKSTNVRAARLQRIEAALKDSRPEVAQRFGDRAYVMTRGAQISSDMAASPTIGTGRRGSKGAFSFPNSDSPLAGSHHRYTPLKDAWPSGQVYYPMQGFTTGSDYAAEWLARTAGYADKYGRTGVERLSGMYSGRVPKGGWSVRPNLRKNKPWPTNYPEDFETNIIKVGEMADGYYKDQVMSLLDEATTFRNRSAWRLQTDPQNRAVFPRIYDWVTEPSWAPEAYQVRVFRAAEEAAKNRKAIPAPRKKIKGGGK